MMTLDQTRERIGLFIHGMPVAMKIDAPKRAIVPTNLPDTDPGTCRWCQSRITLTTKRAPGKWHKRCYAAYQVAKGTVAREYTRLQSANKHCANCGRLPSAWNEWFEIDHKVALALAFYSGDPVAVCESFSTDNLQLLCQSCHATKTRRDMAEIAIARRIFEGIDQ